MHNQGTRNIKVNQGEDRMNHVANRFWFKSDYGYLLVIWWNQNLCSIWFWLIAVRSMKQTSKVKHCGKFPWSILFYSFWKSCFKTNLGVDRDNRAHPYHRYSQRRHRTFAIWVYTVHGRTIFHCLHKYFRHLKNVNVVHKENKNKNTCKRNAKHTNEAS